MESGLIMDEEVAPLDATGGLHLQNKETERSLKSDGGSLIISQQMVTPTESVYPESSSHHVFADIFEGKKDARRLSIVDQLERPCAIPHSIDSASGMVQELTVRNCENLNLAIVGTSSSGDMPDGRLNQWQHLYQTSSGPANGSSLHNFVNHAGSTTSGDMACRSFPETLSSKPHQVEILEQFGDPGKRAVESASTLPLSGTMRTKMISKSGFSQYFIKSTLKGKGIKCRGPPVDSYHLEPKNLSNPQVDIDPKVNSYALVNSEVQSVKPSKHEISGLKAADKDHDGISMREWLNKEHKEVNKLERVNIFKQIVHLAECAHSQGTPLHDLRPSSFNLLPSNQVRYLGSSGRRGMHGVANAKRISNFTNWISMKTPSEPAQFKTLNLGAKKQRLIEDRSHLQRSSLFPSRADMHRGYGEQNPGVEVALYRSNSSYLPPTAEQQLISGTDQFEEKWYQSPEELNEGVTSLSSNIYSLGVFLFELLGHFSSEGARISAMRDLRHRILPPIFLSESTKEAGFCLWLLHPDPASRPSFREILESELLNSLKNELKDVNSEELTLSIEQEDAESELLLHFLETSKEHKKKVASKLFEHIKYLESDIQEIGRRHCVVKSSENSCFGDELNRKFRNYDFTNSSVIPQFPTESRWNGKTNLLESAYFSMRSKVQVPEMDASRHIDNDLLKSSDADELQNPSDQLGVFFDGLCKYARYNKFNVRGILRNGEFNSSANVICSLSFDRDLEYFAAAGVSRKIKIFEFNSLVNQSVDIHYPAVEMSNKSKLSCVSWNDYIRNYLASADYDGIVKLWDASTGQAFSELSEHGKRAWCVHFSPTCPTQLASGSDDCSVKLWSINERDSLRTIKKIANVCCVQFSAHSSHLLALGSADYRTYCYDLRNVRIPWCVLAGHEKAVSYVKFLDSQTIVTASTDNTLKLWDLQKTSTGGSLSTNACSLTLSGHTNEKNFVGLSVADGYIACGSETNEVYSYYRSLQMPITSHKFGSVDPITGKEIEDDNGQFVSSVCWRGNTGMLVAANSSGCIKALQIV